MIMPEKFARVADLFDEAESAVKLVERLQDEGVVVPSINELRYAGFHIIQAIQATDQGSGSEQIARAEKHCKRAIYDALELGILDRLNAIRIFEDDYRLVEVSPVVSNYVELRKEAQDAVTFIHSINHNDDRDNHYEQCKVYFERLSSIAETLQHSRPELNKKLRNLRWKAMATALGLFLGFLTLLFTIIF